MPLVNITSMRITVMHVKEFKMWLNNIGYSDEELETIDSNRLSILEDEYLSLLYGSM